MFNSRKIVELERNVKNLQEKLFDTPEKYIGELYTYDNLSFKSFIDHLIYNQTSQFSQQKEVKYEPKVKAFVPFKKSDVADKVDNRTKIFGRWYYNTEFFYYEDELYKDIKNKIKEENK